MFDILVAGRNRDDLLMVEEMLQNQPGLAVRKRQLLNGLTDPLAELDQMPDLLILSINADSTNDLAALDRRSPAERTNILVIGPSFDSDLMRTAMRAGARDYLHHPLQRTELLAAVERSVKEQQLLGTSSKKKFTAILNAKGGSGASVASSNIAHLFASHFRYTTALVDMDLQFGSLTLNFDTPPNDGLLQAIESADTLDSVALEGWAAKHGSGLRLFSVDHKDLVLAADIPEDKLRRFYDLLGRSYEQVVIDLPRQIDNLFAATIGRADRVVIVMQQSLMHLRDAKSLLKILHRELMVPYDHVVVAVNRFSKKSAITITDIQKALPDVAIVTITNDYAQVTQSLNTGVPLFDFASRAGVTRDLINAAAKIAGRSTIKKSFFHRLLHAEESRVQ